MASYGLNAFVEGLQGGLEAGQKAIDRRNKHRTSEAEYGLLKDDIRKRNEEIGLENESLAPEDQIALLEMPEYEDPYFMRMGKALKGMFGKGDRAKAAPALPVASAAETPAPVAVQPEQMTQPWAANYGPTPQDPYAPQPMADGGPTYRDRASHLRKLALDEEEQKLNERDRSLRVGQALPPAIPADDLRQAGGRGGSYTPRTEASYPDVKGYRANERAAVDKGRADLAQQRAALGTYQATSQGQGRGGARRPAAAAIPAPDSAAGPVPDGSVGPPKSAAAIGSEEVDISQVAQISPEDVPGMSTRDWERYRAKRLAIAAGRGQNLGEVDKEVTQMQMSGFQRYGTMAMTQLQAGNTKGAASLLRAAFQYFPNGNDVKFAMKGNTLFGIGTDEETGKPVGQPMPLTADTVGRMLENFSNPAAWRMWTKDWHEMAMAERQQKHTEAKDEELLGQGRKRLEIDQQRADAAVMAAQKRLGMGVLKFSDTLSASRFFTEVFQNQYGMRPELANELASMAAQLQMKYTDRPPASIVNDVILASGQQSDITALSEEE